MENMGVGAVGCGRYDRGYPVINTGMKRNESTQLFADSMEQKRESIKDLGIGFLFVGNLGMGMSASEVTSSAPDEVIVRVKVSKGGNATETFDINISAVDARNASAIEMFALCQYADVTGTGVDDKWGSWHALKQFSVPAGEVLEYATLEDAVNKKQDWTKALSESSDIIERKSTGETMSAADVFQMLKETMIKEHRLTSDNIKNEEDWREMDAEEWDKLIERIDQYIDALKEELEHMEEIRKEAVWKAMAEAPAAMRTSATSKAMLKVAANGIVGAETDEDVSQLEKNSWTYDLQTEDQVSLATAKLANEYGADMLSKSQEMALIGDTSVGIREAEKLMESASVAENEEKKKIWTITTYTEQRIICNRSEDGITKELWRLDYKNAGDAGKVWSFLSGMERDTDLGFAGIKSFWENFLSETLDTKYHQE